MNLDVNKYLAKSYSAPPCWDLVADVMHEAWGPAVTGYDADPADVRKLAQAFRLTLHRSPGTFRRLDDPEDLCMVLLGNASRSDLHHCGIFWRGSVLHGVEGGNRYEDLSVIRDAYRHVEFWGGRA